MTGTLDLTGTTLVLDTANNGLGTWNLLLGGTITGGIAGGTVRTLNGAALRVTGGILNHLTLGTVNVGTGLSNNDGTVEVTTTVNSGAVVTGGLTVNGTMTVGTNHPGWGLNVSGNQTFDGVGDVRLVTGNYHGFIAFPTANTTLTVGAGLTIRGSGGVIRDDTGGGTLINHGTMAGDQGSLSIAVATFTNSITGRLQSNNAADNLIVAPTTFENYGKIISASGTLDIRPTQFVNFSDVTALGNNRFGVTLQGGTIEASGGTIRLFQGTNTAHSFVVKKLEAELTLAGANPRVYGHTTNTISAAIAELAEIGTAGHLQLRDGAFNVPSGEVIVRGQVDVDATSHFGRARCGAHHHSWAQEPFFS